MTAKRMTFSRCLVALAACVMLLLPSWTAAQEPLVLPRLTGEVILDGRSDEAAWQDVPPLPLVMYQPVYEGEMTERTEIRVAHDDTYLYVAGRLYAQDPADVRANSLYRDRYSGDDTFAVILDTFDDNENALWFFVTPTGTRIDLAVSDDASGGFSSMNSDWNTFWDVATVQDDTGWFAEVRIPFSSLGFQAEGGHVQMGLIAYRYIARKNERHIFPAIPPNWSMGFAKPSQAQPVVLRGVASPRPLYVTPYALGGFAQRNALGEAGAAFRRDDDFTQDLGLDAKYTLTSNLTLDLTVNTDFAQVEADDEQVNLGRFSLFFPEKRQFFQERAGLFEFSTGGSERLFHSRRIGLVAGEPVPILGGVRLTGRLGAWDVGLLEMQTARDRALGVPSENFGVLRVRRRVLNANSFAGGLLASRTGLDGSYNVAYGLDGLFRVVGDEYLTLKWAQTIDDDIVRADAFDFTDAGLFRLEWERRRIEGLYYEASLTRAGADYLPEMGFLRRRNYTGLRGQMAYGFFPGAASPVRTITPELSGEVYFRNEDGTVESAELGHEWEVQLKSGVELEAEAGLAHEDLREPLLLPEGAAVPPGRYTFAGLQLGISPGDASLLRTSANVGAGTFYDGWQASISLSPVWNLSRFLELSGRYEFNHVRFPDRSQRFDVHLARLRAQVALNTHVSTSVFLQYNSAADLVVTNVRFRYNFREGNDLWIVYNEALNTDRRRAAPVLPFTDNRAVLLKYTYTFAL